MDVILLNDKVFSTFAFKLIFIKRFMKKNQISMILVIGKKSHENSMIKAPNFKSPISNFKTHFELSFFWVLP